MDLAKLDKMKVVDLRNELQTRGLDTKGVKAVLIERLRAHVEGSAGGGDGGKLVCVRVRVYVCITALLSARLCVLCVLHNFERFSMCVCV